MSDLSTGRHSPPRRAIGSELPDLNAENSPFDQVLRWLDQASYLSFYSIPDHEHSRTATLTTDPRDYFGINGVFGLALGGTLHRFKSWVRPGRRELRVSQSVGAAVGSYRCRLFTTSADPAWSPGKEPSPAMYDPWRSQRISLVDGELALGRDDRIDVYGIGRTTPALVNGATRSLVGMVGNVTRGYGLFEGLEGTLHLSGWITADLGFEGAVGLRIVDPEGRLRTQEPEPDPPPTELRPQGTYLFLRGTKEDRTVRTEYGDPPDDKRVTLLVPAVMSGVDFPLSVSGTLGIRTATETGPRVASLNAAIYTDILAPLGTPDHPAPFQTRNVYSFFNDRGEEIGSITAEVLLGESFELRFPSAPGQLAMRYGGVGPIVEATGTFRGIQGTVAVNSAVGLAPHALSLLNVLHILPPKPRIDIGIPSKDRRGRRRARPDSGNARLGKSSLPDLNAETHPFEQVQAWLDRAALLNLLTKSDSRSSLEPIHSSRRTVGFRGQTQLFRFRVSMPDPTSRPSVRSSNALGEEVGTFRQHCLLMPDRYTARPGHVPPTTAFSPSRSQRFVLLEADCFFGRNGDGFRAFGTGRTFPTRKGGSPVLAAGVGSILEGFGKFRDLQGTFTFSGSLSPQQGLVGNLFCRVMDPESVLATPSAPGRDAVQPSPESGVTYLVLRGEKRDKSQKSEYIFGPRGDVEGFRLRPDLRLQLCDVTLEGGRIAAWSAAGDRLGELTSSVLLDLSRLGEAGVGDGPPSEFHDYDEFLFTGPDGAVAGSFAFDGGAGRRVVGSSAAVPGGGESFSLSLPEAPDQAALRVAGFGPIVHGKGLFEGVTGLVTYNGAVAIAPHVISFVFVARLEDPDGKLRQEGVPRGRPDLP